MKGIFTKTIGLSLNALAHIAPRKTAQVGYELFCRPFRVTVNDKHKTFLDSAEKESFEFKGNTIQTYRWGTSARKILLLHGWQSHTYRWKMYIEALSKDFTVHAFDAPGHGLSSGHLLNVPVYSDVIEEQIKRIGEIDTLITHSLGGFAAFYTFYQNPALGVKKLIALAPPGEAQEFFDFYKKTLKLSEKCATLITDRFEEIFQRSPAFFSAPAFASSITIPGLIIHDEDDDETPVIHAERIHQAWKNSRLIKTKGFGHNLRSSEVIREVVRFVNEPLPHPYKTDPIPAANTN